MPISEYAFGRVGDHLFDTFSTKLKIKGILSLDTEHNIEKNPFYLGNLLKTDLIKLLDDNKGSKTKAYTQIIKDVHNQVKKDFCSVISVYNSGSLSDNHDPLSPTYVDG